MTEKMYTQKEFTDAFRAAIEDRARWFYLLLKYAKEQGADTKKMAEKAITEFGKMKGKAIGKAETAKDFAYAIYSGPAKDAFAMNAVKLDDDESIIEFKYCALVEAWKKLGCSSDEVAELCRLARYGDYGMASCFPNIALKFDKLLSEGQDCCKMVITKNQ